MPHRNPQGPGAGAPPPVSTDPETGGEKTLRLEQPGRLPRSFKYKFQSISNRTGGGSNSDVIALNVPTRSLAVVQQSHLTLEDQSGSGVNIVFRRDHQSNKGAPDFFQSEKLISLGADERANFAGAQSLSPPGEIFEPGTRVTWFISAGDDFDAQISLIVALFFIGEKGARISSR